MGRAGSDMKPAKRRIKTQDDVKDPAALVAAQDREENAAQKSITQPVVDAARQAFMGSDVQNDIAAAQMRKEDAANPDTMQARINKFTGYGGYNKGGKVSPASKRADGAAIRGKTRGTIR